jgi:hypothetical protein
MKKPTEFIVNDKLFSIFIAIFTFIVIGSIIYLYSLTSQLETKINEAVQKQRVLVIDDYGNTKLTTFYKSKPNFLKKFSFILFEKMFYFNNDYIKENLDYISNFLTKKAYNEYYNKSKKLIKEVLIVNSIYFPIVKYYNFKNNTAYFIFQYKYFFQNEIKMLSHNYFLVKIHFTDGSPTVKNSIGIYVDNVKIGVIENNDKISMSFLVKKLENL